jgi:2-keto-4-pentenoate hydratase/2-oxohepta-3-ene-1,7-dioic acid hydratase in catechol pathway
MKIVRFKGKAGDIRYGIHEGDRIAFAEGDPFTGLRPTKTSVPAKDAKLLAPVAPPNILAVGRNYKAHAAEGGDDLPKAPLLFIKATTSVTGPGDPIVIPAVAPTEVDYEAELAVVIGKTARNVKEEEALRFVLGYTCANDVSARDCQRNDGQWARAKSFDAFAPLGPWIETELDPGNRPIRCRVNGVTLQDANTSLLIFSVQHLIAYLSAGMTLLPGTVLLTGTPAGVGFARKPPVWLKPGDDVEVEIEGIGVLRNPVTAG